MTEHSLLQEIEADLQRQKYEKLWQRFGVYIIGAVFAIILGTAAFTMWRAHVTAVQQADTGAYLETKENLGLTPDQQIEAFEKQARQDTTMGPKIFAQLEAAALAAKKGDTQKAGELYNALATDATVDPLFRHFADLLYVQSQMDKGNAEVLLARLQPVMQDKAWGLSAREYAGYLTLKLGRKEEARLIFITLAQESDAPTSLVQRARDMAGWIGQTE